MPILYIMCGVPGCGKSTWIAQNIRKNEVCVSRDKIRFNRLLPQDAYFSKEKDVFKEFVNTISKALDEGIDVYADATHLNENARNKLIDNLTTSAEIDIIPIVFLIPEAICQERNTQRKGRAQVPPEVITNMSASFEPATFNEKYKYKEIVFISSKGEQKEVFAL